MPKYCPSSLSPALVQKKPRVLVGYVFIEKRLGCLSYKSYSTVSTGQKRSHCPQQTFLFIQQACKELPPLGNFLAGNQYQVNKQLHQAGRCALDHVESYYSKYSTHILSKQNGSSLIHIYQLLWIIQ